MNAVDAISIGCLPAGMAGGLVYCHMERREREREQGRPFTEQGIEPFGTTRRLTRISDWLVFVAMPGVLGGAMLGVVGWLVIALPLVALGVVH